MTAQAEENKHCRGSRNFSGAGRLLRTRQSLPIARRDGGIDRSALPNGTPETHVQLPAPLRLTLMSCFFSPLTFASKGGAGLTPPFDLLLRGNAEAALGVGSHFGEDPDPVQACNRVLLGAEGEVTAHRQFRSSRRSYKNRVGEFRHIHHHAEVIGNSRGVRNG